MVRSHEEDPMQCLKQDLVSFAGQSSRTEEGRLAGHRRGHQVDIIETSNWTLAMWSVVGGEA